MVLRLAALLLRHRMGVVEADQPLAIRAMQRERIIQPVRLFRGWRDLRDNEPDSVSTLRVHDQREVMQVEQSVESRIVLLHDIERLSDYDNHCNPVVCEGAFGGAIYWDKCPIATCFVTVDPWLT